VVAREMIFLSASFSLRAESGHVVSFLAPQARELHCAFLRPFLSLGTDVSSIYPFPLRKTNPFSLQSIFFPWDRGDFGRGLNLFFDLAFGRRSLPRHHGSPLSLAPGMASFFPQSFLPAMHQINHADTCSP